MRIISEVYMKFYTNSSNTTFEFISIKDFLDIHQDTYQDGSSDFLYEKVDGEFQIIY